MFCDENKEVSILNGVERLNVDIPSNKQKVRLHYEEQIKERMIKEHPKEEEEEHKEDNKDEQEQKYSSKQLIKV